ncbi:hypothetical protein LFZ20_05180 [Salmonella enterica subsp. enterica serovar Johannesburg str. SA20025782]|nr:hypothetical protein LFZ20_05180 [Salmonella enterica subsp. enterica serovar Johannesburg str. SA20025782]
MALRLSGLRFYMLPHTQKRPVLTDGLLHLSDAWQFMEGVLPATLRAVAAQRSNPLPADLSSSGERSPTDYRQKQKALSSDRALRLI